jgi:hypothetical protein
MQIQPAVQQVAQLAMTEKDWWTLAITAMFTLLVALGGAGLTLWWPNRKQKRDAKLRVFSTLVMHRRSNPPHFEWVNALNLIDIVFSNDGEVLNKWHTLYAILQNQQAGTEQYQHTYLEMLSSWPACWVTRNFSQRILTSFTFHRLSPIRPMQMRRFKPW